MSTSLQRKVVRIETGPSVCAGTHHDQAAMSEYIGSQAILFEIVYARPGRLRVTIKTRVGISAVSVENISRCASDRLGHRRCSFIHRSFWRKTRHEQLDTMTRPSVTEIPNN
jgi:hypothetical protein